MVGCGWIGGFVEFNISTYIKDTGEITQDVSMKNDGSWECLMRSVIQAKSTQVSQALVSLGWQPPIVRDLGRLEPVVVINNEQLTDAQVVTLRVALNTFAIDLKSGTLGEDEHGRRMTNAYLARLSEVMRIVSQ